MISWCDIVEYTDDEVSFDGLSAACSILQYFFSLCEKCEGLFVRAEIDFSFGLIVDGLNLRHEMV